MREESYLSASWFHSVRELMRDDEQSMGDFIVQFEVCEPAGMPVPHHMVFQEASLIGWRPGRSILRSSCHLVVGGRTVEADYADFFGSDELLFAAPLEYSVPGESESFNLLGLPAASARAVVPVSMADLAIDVKLTVVDRLLGPTRVDLEVRGCSVLCGAASSGVDVSIAAPFESLLAWLHGDDVLLGHLITSGCEVKGSLPHLSALEGTIAAEVAESSASRSEVVEQLSSYRLHRRGLLESDLFRRIRDLTVQPHRL